jgi:hypothetical protein
METSELELELIQTQMAQKLMLRAEVGMPNARALRKQSKCGMIQGGRGIGHKRPACMLLFVFLRRCFSFHCHSADEEGVPVPSKPLMAQGQNNRRLAR